MAPQRRRWEKNYSKLRKLLWFWRYRLCKFTVLKWLGLTLASFIVVAERLVFVLVFTFWLLVLKFKLFSESSEFLNLNWL